MRTSCFVLWLRAAVGAAGAAVGGEQTPLRDGLDAAEITAYGHDAIPIADEAFEKYIEKQMGTWHVPGLAIALIEGNKTWAKV